MYLGRWDANTINEGIKPYVETWIKNKNLSWTPDIRFEYNFAGKFCYLMISRKYDKKQFYSIVYFKQFPSCCGLIELYTLNKEHYCEESTEEQEDEITSLVLEFAEECIYNLFGYSSMIYTATGGQGWQRSTLIQQGFTQDETYKFKNRRTNNLIYFLFKNLGEPL